MSRPPVIRTKQELKAKLALLEVTKGQELNLAATLASQPAAGHSLSFISTIDITTLG